MIFRQLDRTKLNEYSTDICTGCKQLFHPDMLSSHIASCPNMRLSQNTDSSPASQVSINSASSSVPIPTASSAAPNATDTTDDISNLRRIVPTDHLETFNALIQDTTITRDQLRNKVMDWILDSNKQF